MGNSLTRSRTTDPAFALALPPTLVEATVMGGALLA